MRRDVARAHRVEQMQGTELPGGVPEARGDRVEFADLARIGVGGADGFGALHGALRSISARVPRRAARLDKRPRKRFTRQFLARVVAALRGRISPLFHGPSALPTPIVNG